MWKEKKKHSHILQSLFWNPLNHIVVKEFLTISAHPGHSLTIFSIIIISHIIFITSYHLFIYCKEPQANPSFPLCYFLFPVTSNKPCWPYFLTPSTNLIWHLPFMCYHAHWGPNPELKRSDPKMRLFYPLVTATEDVLIPSYSKGGPAISSGSITENLLGL